jgi:hypothetical protein
VCVPACGWPAGRGRDRCAPTLHGAHAATLGATLGVCGGLSEVASLLRVAWRNYIADAESFVILSSEPTLGRTSAPLLSAVLLTTKIREVISIGSRLGRLARAHAPSVGPRAARKLHRRRRH